MLKRREALEKPRELTKACSDKFPWCLDNVYISSGHGAVERAPSLNGALLLFTVVCFAHENLARIWRVTSSDDRTIIN